MLSFPVHASVSFLWLSGVVFWMVESFLLLLLLQPTHALSLTQRMGLLWGLLVFSQLLLVSQFMTRQRVIAIVEMQAMSQSPRLWLYELLAFWMMYAVLFVSLSPIVCLLYGLEMSYLFILFFLWGCVARVLSSAVSGSSGLFVFKEWFFHRCIGGDTLDDSQCAFSFALFTYVCIRVGSVQSTILAAWC